MNYKQIMTWGKRWHYPQLILGPGQHDYIRHGKQSYELLRADRVRQLLAAERIARWNALAQKGKP